MINPEELAQLVSELKAENEQAKQAIDDEMEAYLATSVKPEDTERTQTNYEELVKDCNRENEDAFRIFRENVLGSKDLASEKEHLLNKLDISRAALSGYLVTKTS